MQGCTVEIFNPCWSKVKAKMGLSPTSMYVVRGDRQSSQTCIIHYQSNEKHHKLGLQVQEPLSSKMKIKEMKMVPQHMSPQNLIDKIACKPYLKSSVCLKKGEKVVFEIRFLISAIFWLVKRRANYGESSFIFA